MLHLARKAFLDRLMGAVELRGLCEMWRGWFRSPRPGSPPGESGRYRLEARIYGFPRQEANLQAALQSRVSRLQAEVCLRDRDTIEVIGTFAPDDRPCNAQLWLHVLGTEQVNGLCVMLRVILEGVTGREGSRPTSTGTLALCGAAKEGRLLVKALWAVSGGERAERVYRLTDWPESRAFLKAFDLFCHLESQLTAANPMAALAEHAGPQAFTCTDIAEAQMSYRVLAGLGVSRQSIRLEGATVTCEATPTACAQAASYARFSNSGRAALFMTGGSERVASLLTRQLVEFPGDHGPGAFALRVLTPLALAAGAGTYAMSLDPDERPTERAVLFALAAIGVCVLLRVIIGKLRRIRAYHARMNQGLGRLYAQPVNFVPVDLATLGLNDDPMLRKYTEELEALGARQVGDVRTVTGVNIRSGSRWFVLPRENTRIALSLMTQTENLTYFPAKPILHCASRFRDGHRHATSSGDGYRKTRMPRRSGVAVRDGDPHQVLACHRAALRRLIQAGHEPVAPALHLDALVADEVADFQETVAFYRNRKIYSWGDALHQVFKIPRRESRPLPGDEQTDQEPPAEPAPSPIEAPAAQT